MDDERKWFVRINWHRINSILAKLIRRGIWPLVFLITVTLYIKHFAYDITNINFNARLVLDYIAVLRWPLIALTGLLILKPHLGTIIKRIKTASYKGIKVDMDDPQSGTSKARNFTESNPTVDDPTTEEDDPDVVALLTSPEANDIYVSLLSSIYGTQLEALRRLNSYPTSGLTDNDIADLVEVHKVRATSVNVNEYQSVKAFMAFLVTNSLALYRENDQHYQLTYFGKYFLQYLFDNNLLDDNLNNL